MAITDYIVSFLSILCLLRGASRGFINSLLGPFSIIVTTIASIIYYQTTKDMVISLLIGLIGPLLLTFLLKFLLKSWAKANNSEIKPNFVSRLGGAILTLAWGWVFIIFTLILLAILPSMGDNLTALHNDVTRSVSYNTIKPWGAVFLGIPKQNADTQTAAARTSEAKSLAEDPRFKKVLQDPEIQKEVQAHDIVKLMQNPKMMELTQQLMSDPAMMKKVMAFYSSGSTALTASQTQPQANKTSY